uniref:DNA/RNA-binding protein Alba-like domain-containing protein n=1 Tax=Picocystis salinarum TaxID=88271 RepID=A0A7S3XD84_9CHLO|mmetsp:Transcript_1044/g.6615  ORF Transcript_1044/g.6615 Transcript_1044/m.6615 type:complete len:110 (+) Transcript_1044:480-809(+)
MFHRSIGDACRTDDACIDLCLGFAPQKFLQAHDEVELSALGMAISSVVTVAEILKNQGYAVEKKIETSTVEVDGEMKNKPKQKAKLVIILGKSDKFDELMAAKDEETTK